jgi:hypothetical protein
MIHRILSFFRAVWREADLAHDYDMRIPWHTYRQIMERND